MRKSSKKISLDLHGVINDLTPVFKNINESLIKDGWEVHIITGSTTQKALLELRELGMEQNKHFTHVVGVPDYCLMIGMVAKNYNETYGNHEFGSDDWNKAKAIYCETNQIDLHMDDTLEYGNSFVTPFARLYTKNK